MSQQTVVKTGGVGFLGLLGIAFIVLKLCNVITWSWWWVLAPLWAPIALWVSIVVIILFFVAVASFLTALVGWK